MSIKDRGIYIVLSDSGSAISKILRLFTKAKYNHVSISVKEDLSEMYSFGRRWKYYAFYGGFVRETPYTGVFGVFPKAEIAVFPLSVTEMQCEGIKTRLNEMYAQRKKYKYSWLGVFMVPFRKKLNRKRHYYCSEFVRKILLEFGVMKEEEFPAVTTPNDFLHILNGKQTYEGKYRDYMVAPPETEREEEKQAV